MPFCGGTEFLESAEHTRKTVIKTSTGLVRKAPVMECTAHRFSYLCTKCNSTYYAFNEEEFYEKLKRACGLVGKLRYMINFDTLEIHKVRVSEIADTELSSVVINHNYTDHIPVQDLYKTLKDARKDLLRYLYDKRDSEAAQWDKSWKKCQKYDALIKDLRRKI